MVFKKTKISSSKNKNHRLILTIQFCCAANESLRSILPRTLLYKWISQGLEQDMELTLRFVNVDEAQRLNFLYRQKSYTPNVLTFTYNEEKQANQTTTINHVVQKAIFADIILCCNKIQEEAAEQAKPLIAHYAHLIIHGVLHAQGYEHEQENDAIKMEQKEVEILKNLGFSSPYLLEEN